MSAPSGGREAAPSRYLANNLRREASREARYGLRRGLWKVTNLPRLAHCGRYLTGDYTRLHVKDGAAYYCDVQTCGSVWSCPVCAARIRQRRAIEVERVTLAHLEGAGSAGFLTTTFPHSRDDDLGLMLDTLTKCWAKVQNSSRYSKAAKALGIVGFIRATEVTYGAWHGWHPHLHLLLFSDHDLTCEDWSGFRDLISDIWAAAVVKCGRDRPGEVVGVTLAPVKSSGVGRYLAKVQDHYGEASGIGREMQRGDVKKGRKRSRTPFELAEAATSGCVPELPLWWAYEAATKGRRSLAVSKVLRDRYGWDESTDDDLAKADADGVAVTSLSAAQYGLLVAAGDESLVLDLAEDGGAPAVHAHLEALARAFASDDEP